MKRLILPLWGAILGGLIGGVLGLVFEDQLDVFMSKYIVVFHTFSLAILGGALIGFILFSIPIIGKIFGGNSRRR